MKETDYDPWAESHEPKKFERTDKTGRQSPLYEKPFAPDTEYMLLIGVLAFGAGFTVLILLMLYVLSNLK